MISGKRRKEEQRVKERMDIVKYQRRQQEVPSWLRERLDKKLERTAKKIQETESGI